MMTAAANSAGQQKHPSNNHEHPEGSKEAMHQYRADKEAETNNLTIIAKKQTRVLKPKRSHQK